MGAAEEDAVGVLILEPGFAVLNPNGRDQTKIFAQGAGSPSDDGHAPVNYHGYAACCHGGFFRKVEEVPNAVGGVLILLRRNGIRAAMNAVRELRKRGKQVRISWKESGLPQVGHALANSGLRRKFHALCSAADGFISSTPDLVPLYEAAGCRKGRFVPTPYPIEEPGWDFSVPISQRTGIFIGTREFGVPSRNHFLAVACISALGQPVTVINTEGWAGARFLRSISPHLRIVSGTLPYADYLRLMAQHRVVFQLDRSGVPGQVAGDSLLCGVPCLGGDGAIDGLVFPKLCAASLSAEAAVKMVKRLLVDNDLYRETIENAREFALKRVSFSNVKTELLAEFGLSPGGVL